MGQLDKRIIILRDDVYIKNLSNVFCQDTNLDVKITDINQLIMDFHDYKNTTLLISDNGYEIINNIKDREDEVEKLNTILLCTCYANECKKKKHSHLLHIIDCIRMDTNEVEQKIKTICMKQIHG